MKAKTQPKKSPTKRKPKNEPKRMTPSPTCPASDESASGDVADPVIPTTTRLNAKIIPGDVLMDDDFVDVVHPTPLGWAKVFSYLAPTLKVVLQ